MLILNKIPSEQCVMIGSRTSVSESYNDSSTYGQHHHHVRPELSTLTDSDLASPSHLNRLSFGNPARATQPRIQPHYLPD